MLPYQHLVHPWAPRSATVNYSFLYQLWIQGPPWYSPFCGPNFSRYTPRSVTRLSRMVIVHSILRFDDIVLVLFLSGSQWRIQGKFPRYSLWEIFWRKDPSIEKREILYFKLQTSQHRKVLGHEISALARYDIAQQIEKEKYRCHYRIDSFGV